MNLEMPNASFNNFTIVFISGLCGFTNNSIFTFTTNLKQSQCWADYEISKLMLNLKL